MQLLRPRILILLIGILLILSEFTLVEAGGIDRSKKKGLSGGKSAVKGLFGGKSVVKGPSGGKSVVKGLSGGKSAVKGSRKKVAKLKLKHLHMDVGIHVGKAAPPKPPEPSCTETELDQNCLSCTGFIYRECPVVGAKKILDIKLKREYLTSKRSCMIGHRQNYGISKDKKSITVNYGCRGLFTVCYQKDTNKASPKEPKIIDCAARSDGGARVCPLHLHQPDIVLSVSYLWGFGRCKRDEDWGFDDHNVWTKGSCSATFRVVWA